MTKRIIVHGGYPKAGSTALQHFFAHHRDALAESGILYPKTGIPLFDRAWIEHGHHNLPNSFSNSPQHYRYDLKSGGFKELSDEWRSSGKDILLLSSESFIETLCYAHAELKQKLQDTFPTIQVDFVFVIRNLFDYFVTNVIQERIEWMLGLHSGIMRNLQQEINDIERYGWYSDPVQASQDLFGTDHTHIIPYMPDIIPAFCESSGLNARGFIGTSSEFRTNKRAPAKQTKLMLNISSSPDALELRERFKTSNVNWNDLFEHDTVEYNLFSGSASEAALRACEALMLRCKSIPQSKPDPRNPLWIDLRDVVYTPTERARLTELFGQKIMARCETEYLA